MMSCIGRSLIAAFGLAALPFAASAQSDISSQIEARLNAGVQNLQQACGAELQKYCADVLPGEGRLFYCALAHEDKLSQKCDYAIYKSMDALARLLEGMERVAAACGPDIEKRCVTVEPGGGQILQCLAKDTASLQASCKQVLDQLPFKKQQQ